MKSFRTRLSGWGNYPVAESLVCKPDGLSELARELRTVTTGGMIARGLGRSYGDPAQNSEGLVVDCTGLDRYLAFDAATGTLTCEAGTSLKQIIDDFAPRGFFPMITPGTKFVTVGGCIANDVHGKAHHVDGCFSRCVDEMTVLVADGRVLRASRNENADLFWGCFGGMGLLGIVLTAQLRLRRVETTYFHQKAVRTDNLEELLDAIDLYDKQYRYSVAWIDSLATGKSLGKGVLTCGDHADRNDLPESLQQDPLRTTPPSPVVVPFDMPSQTLNGVTIRILNQVLGFVQAHGAELAHYEKFFYPLDFVGDWNRGYGKAGFTQYQFVVPLRDGRRTIRTLLEAISASGQAPFLNVLKKFGAEEGMLSFPMEGYTFAIDFPVRAGLKELLQRLDALVLEAGGRVYLGKDAFLNADTFFKMYPRAAEWLAIKQKYDPTNLFQSDLGRRVGLVP